MLGGNSSLTCALITTSPLPSSYTASSVLCLCGRSSRQHSYAIKPIASLGNSNSSNKLAVCSTPRKPLTYTGDGSFPRSEFPLRKMCSDFFGMDRRLYRFTGGKYDLPAPACYGYPTLSPAAFMFCLWCPSLGLVPHVCG